MSEEMQNTISCKLSEYEIRTHAPFWKRIIHNKMLMVGGTIVALLVMIAIFAPFLTGYDPVEMDMVHRFEPPSAKHLMGTDQFGRDVLVRIIYGSRLSLQVGSIATLIGLSFGMILGAISGFLRGSIDDILMRIMDSLMAFPPLLLSVALVAAVGPSTETVSVVIGLIYIPSFARITRSSVIGEVEKEYVEAVRAIGQKNIIILLKHIGPNCLSPVLVVATVAFANAIITEAILSFLGIGVPPPTPSWGTMLNESRSYLASSVYLAIFPGLTISVAVLGLNLLGDGLRDLLDPRTYKHGG